MNPTSSETCSSTVVLYRHPDDVRRPDPGLASSLDALGIYVRQGVSLREHVQRIQFRLWFLPLLAGAIVTLLVDGIIGLAVTVACLIGARAFHRRNLLRASAFVHRVAKLQPDLVQRLWLERDDAEPGCWLQLRDAVPVRLAHGQDAEAVFSVIKAHLELTTATFTLIDTRRKAAVEA